MSTLFTFIGDIRAANSFPWFSTSIHHHKISIEEALEGMLEVKYGDVGLHTDTGYLSNFFIPGFMKHAWVHTTDGFHGQIVEAISEGVVQRSAMYPMLSDYTIILSPINVTDEDRKGACVKANRIVGEKYDFDFEFDVEEELKFYKGKHTTSATNDLTSCSTGLKHRHGFSCTEVASYSWWHKRENLGLYREKHFGKDVILADFFINRHWKIAWASSSVTVDTAKEMGLCEEGLSLIEDYYK
jgi:hypothetical protein